MDNSDLLCHICYRKESRGKTADGALAEGDSYYNRGKFADAAGAYQEALNILGAYNGCSLCKQRIQRLIDRC